MKKLLTIISFPLFILSAGHIPFGKLPPLCYFYLCTHLPCPTCGMTRSVSAIARLEFVRAWTYNPLGFLFVGMLALVWSNGLYASFAGRKSQVSVWLERHAVFLTVASLGTLVLYGIARIWLCARGFFSFPAG